MSIIYVQTNEFYIEKHTLKKPQNDMHYHHTYELYYILEGEREYFIEDRFFHVKKGDLVWVPADMLHRTNGLGATRFLLYFRESFLEQYFSEATIERLTQREPFVFTPASEYATQFQTLFFDILKEYNKKMTQDENCDEFILAKLVFDLLYFVSTHENHYIGCGNGPSERMYTVIKYINNNYRNPLSIQEVADAVGITRDHLCHIFPRYMGVTFITYLNVIRIKAACEMMKKEKDSILEISSKCGFSSSHYFCKVFKKEKGMSPSEYRRQFKSRHSFRYGPEDDVK